MERLYENFIFSDKGEIKKLLIQSEEMEIPKILIGAVNGINDLEWLQELLISYIKHDNYWVGKTAIHLFGDLDRIYPTLDKNKIINILQSIDRDEFRHVINETIEDIKINIIR